MKHVCKMLIFLHLRIENAKIYIFPISQGPDCHRSLRSEGGLARRFEGGFRSFCLRFRPKVWVHVQQTPHLAAGVPGIKSQEIYQLSFHDKGYLIQWISSIRFWLTSICLQISNSWPDSDWWVFLLEIPKSHKNANRVIKPLVYTGNNSDNPGETCQNIHKRGKCLKTLFYRKLLRVLGRTPPSWRGICQFQMNWGTSKAVSGWLP